MLFGAAVFALYISNGKYDPASDTEPSTYLPLAIVRGDGLHLEHVAPQLQNTYVVTTARGHLVSRYPLAPALAALPATTLQVVLLNVIYPEWTRDTSPLFPHFFAKNSHALITALAAVLLLRLCLKLSTSSGVAWTAALAAALGSSLWSVASQGAWQHGLAALGLTTAMSALIDERRSRGALVLAGIAASVMVASRSLDIVFAGALAAWVFYHYRGMAGWFLPGPIVIGAALLTYNLYYFGAIDGGQSQLETYHPLHHHVSGTWTGNIVEGALGTLFSPSRGLLVYTPWIACALVGVFFYWRALPSMVRWLLAGLIANGLLLSKYSCWWAGWSFGPRFWTDAIPLFSILFAVTLDQAVRRHRPLLLPAASLVLTAIVIHGLGAYGYPSSWFGTPVRADWAHERLWDWRDSELTRIIKEGAREPVLWRWNR